MLTGLYFLAGLWESVPLFVRAVYIGWVIYAVFYWVLLRYEKEHNLVIPRQLSNVNYAYSYYALLGITVIADRFIIYRTPNLHFIADQNTYETLATVGYTLMVVGLLSVISARITLNGFWGGGIYKYEPNFKEFVHTGLYGHVRHPVYFGQILLALGMILVMNIWVLWFFPIFAALFNIIRARAEEVDLHERIGAPYEAYRKRTQFILPWFW
jgi:protein-S-isoprenylcysteine O-methyltransferase Ste14